MIELKTSLDWTPVEADLIKKTLKLKHGAQIRKMITNLGKLVTQLSIAEVEARQGRRNRAEELLVKVNADIHTVEGFLLVAALMG